MIAGDTRQRNFTLPVPDPPKSDWSGDQSTQSALAAKAIGFNCLNYAIAPEGSLYRHFLPDNAYLDANCTDGVRFELMFPSCWNGKDVDSSDHKSHMAYPSLVMTGYCPSGFETRLVSLFYETIWNTYAFKARDGQFAIANGDPTGYGYHGDFIQAWDPGFLQQAVNTCTNPSGQVQDCPLFNLQDDGTAAQCSLDIPSQIASEHCTEPTSGLPGNVAIQSGPGYAKPLSAGGGSGSRPATAATSMPSLGYSSAGPEATVTDKYGGGVFAESSSYAAAPSPASTPAPAPVDKAVDHGDEVATAYYTEGAMVYEVILVQEVTTVMVESLPTDKPFVAGRKKRHLHHHAHGHGARRFM